MKILPDTYAQCLADIIAAHVEADLLSIINVSFDAFDARLKKHNIEVGPDPAEGKIPEWNPWEDR